MLGTPCYMSPEQAQGTKQVDHRTDLWALGIIAYRCLVGRLPFDSEALGDLLLKIMMQPLPVPSHEAPHLPQAFDVWWVRAAARDAAARFQTAKELSEALSQALGVSPSVLGRTPALADGGVAAGPMMGGYSAQGSGSSRPGGFAGTTPAGFSGARAQTPMHPPTMAAHPAYLTPPGAHVHATVSEPPAAPYAMPAPPPYGNASVPPAAHTFDGRSGKGRSGLVVALVGVICLLAGGILVFALRGGGDKDKDKDSAAAQTDTTAPSASARSAPAVPAVPVAAVTAEPVVQPQPASMPTATAAAAAPIPKPPRTGKVQPLPPPPSPPPSPPPAPARTGKVVIQPP
jgi:serine/threonine-protein kinase